MRELNPGPLTQHAVKGQRAVGVGGSTGGSTGSVWRKAGVHSVHVVHGFP